MSLKVLLTLTVAAATLAACSPNTNSAAKGLVDAQANQKIIGGSEVSADDAIAASTVALVIKTKDAPEGSYAACTGTLVADQIVLTAAHCMEDAVSVVVVFSTDVENLKDRSSLRNVTNVVVNSKYKPSDTDQNWNDLALIKFEGNAPAGYTKVALQTDVADLQSAQQAVLAGYGATSMDASGNPQGSMVLRQVTVALANASFSKTEILLGNATENKGACHGDSGGPAFVQQGGQLVQVGVTSRASTMDGGKTCQGGTIYTSVAAQKAFINKAIATLQKAKAPAATTTSPAGN